VLPELTRQPEYHVVLGAMPFVHAAKWIHLTVALVAIAYTTAMVLAETGRRLNSLGQRIT
jgi:hypothetical protein